jgi:hypothetical protein
MSLTLLAIMNMLPLWLLASRNNPLVVWTGISFDTYNLVHRWLGRIVVLETLVHGIAWTIKKVKFGGGWGTVPSTFTHSTFLLSGLIVSKSSDTTNHANHMLQGVCASTLLLLHSPSAIRHAFYETFLGIHILLAALSLGAVYVHLEGKTYHNERMIIVGVLAIWCVEVSSS